VSPDAIVVGVFGVLGVVAGVLVERIARSWGRLRCEASVRSLRLTGVEDEEGYPREVRLEDADETTEANGASYHAALTLFNGKEVPTGLRDLAVVFVSADGRREPDHPDDPESARRTSAGTFIFDRLAVLNLQPRQFKRLELRGEFGKDAADALKTGRWERIMFEAQRPKRPLLWRKTYRKTIIKP